MARFISFEVEGPLYGYRSSRDRMWGKQGAAYKAFKQRVLALAWKAGWQGSRGLTSSSQVGHLSVHVAWRKSPRIDWKNVYGAIEDAMFEQDRYVVPGDSNGVDWNTGVVEHAIVQISF